jgi:hypothetical protein
MGACAGCCDYPMRVTADSNARSITPDHVSIARQCDVARQVHYVCTLCNVTMFGKMSPHTSSMDSRVTRYIRVDQILRATGFTRFQDLA